MSEILDKTGEMVIVGGHRSSGRCYHTDDSCYCVGLMESPKEKDRAVAEWKGLSLCPVCDPETDTHINVSLTAADVENCRKRALNGETAAAIAKDMPVGVDSIRKYLSGAYEESYAELSPGPLEYEQPDWVRE